jgi:hypothetical protein
LIPTEYYSIAYGTLCILGILIKNDTLCIEGLLQESDTLIVLGFSFHAWHACKGWGTSHIRHASKRKGFLIRTARFIPSAFFSYTARLLSHNP